MSLQEELFALIAKDVPQKGDAIVVLEGDGLARVDRGAELYKNEFAQTIVLSGGLTNPPFSVPAPEMKQRLLELGIPESTVTLEGRSQNTREQAAEVLKLVKEKNWQSLLLVASPEHQARAFLTFLKAMNEAGLQIRIYNTPVAREQKDMTSEVAKIGEYAAKGHVASYEEGIEYLQWRSKE